MHIKVLLYSIVMMHSNSNRWIDANSQMDHVYMHIKVCAQGQPMLCVCYTYITHSQLLISTTVATTVPTTSLSTYH